MIVCLCHNLSEKTIREKVPEGKTVRGTYLLCGVERLRCGICASEAQRIVKDERENVHKPIPDVTRE